MSNRIREPGIVDSFDEEPVDARRYIEALCRRVGLIAAVSVGVAAFVLLISLGLPKRLSRDRPDRAAGAGDRP